VEGMVWDLMFYGLVLYTFFYYRVSWWWGMGVAVFRGFVRLIGRSYGVTIPVEVVDRLGLRAGDYVVVRIGDVVFAARVFCPGKVLAITIPPRIAEKLGVGAGCEVDVRVRRADEVV